MAEELKQIVLISTLIFLLAPLSLVFYIFAYNLRKKRHAEETAQLKLAFEAELLKTQIEIQEQTMQTIGFDLHDNIGQLLSLTNLILKSIVLENSTAAQQKIDTVIDLTSRSIQELRLLGKLLQGEQLTKQGLPGAVKMQMEWLSRINLFEVRMRCDVPDKFSIDRDKELIIFRLFQEIIHNTVKHAEPTQITVHLQFLDDKFLLSVEDNGKGFDLASTQESPGGLGLLSINRRMHLIGGTAEIYTQIGRGTTVVLKIKIDA